MEKKKKKARINRDQRANIQAAIAMGKTLAETAAIIRRPRSTVYREVLGNAEARDGSHSCSSCSKGDYGKIKSANSGNITFTSFGNGR